MFAFSINPKYFFFPLISFLTDALFRIMLLSFQVCEDFPDILLFDFWFNYLNFVITVSKHLE